MNLHLIGYRGTGKSTVARRLAGKLGWDWADCDVEVERRAGKSIAEMFIESGEEAFRELEARTLDELTRRDRLVLATGGGAILREDNRRALARGKVVWLRSRPETIARRLAADDATASQRPALTGQGVLQEIVALLEQREPLYRQCADVEIDADEQPAEAVADEILRRIAPHDEARA